MKNLKSMMLGVSMVALCSCAPSNPTQTAQQVEQKSDSAIVIENIMSRRSIRKYKPQPVEREKMAVITEKFLHGYQVPAVYVVGGSSMFKEFTTVFEKKLKLPVYRPVHPLLVTPLGIAYHCELPKI